MILVTVADSACICSLIGVHYNCITHLKSHCMKTATLPTVRVLPEIRAQAEALLEDGESLSMFIEDSLRRQITLRQSEREFIARGMAAGARARETGEMVSAEDSLARLRALAKRQKSSVKV